MTGRKVKVITTVAAWPEALELQRKLLDRYLQDEFEFIAFVDTPEEPGSFNLWNPELRLKSASLAEEYCDRKYLVPDFLHRNRRAQFPHTREKLAVNANLRAADSLQFAWESEIRDSKSPVLILDNDMFPVTKFSVREHLEIQPFAGIVNHSHGKKSKNPIPWLWSGLLMLNPSLMPERSLWSFDCGKVDGVHVDVSGQTAHWYRKHQELVKKLTHLPSLTWTDGDTNFKFTTNQLKFLSQDTRNSKGKYYCELYTSQFIHYRGGSNWNREDAFTVSTRFDDFIHAFAN